ncbi:hypothetical protein GCM10027176_26340 [Actinoallomurus bryophytorum]
MRTLRRDPAASAPAVRRPPDGRRKGAVNDTTSVTEAAGGSPDRTSLSFTEEMKGFCTDGENAPGPGEEAHASRREEATP